MWLNKSYEEILEKSIELGVQPEDGVGITDDMEDKLAARFGMIIGRMPYMAGLKGILGVPSLNFPRKCQPRI